jgi:23S rRNA (cytidine1920-2'-O)/16S rRNA (cytidine1409-2'-O)-methyltransferase
VSRGGDKLDAALARFAVGVDGRQALDAGASTGGFTDCLLQRGAAHVYAVDVGRGQLHPRLRGDPRVTVLERTDVRRVRLSDLGGRPLPLLVADLSFISLDAVAGSLVELAAPGADLVVLVKPQFEVGRAEASRAKGVVRRPELWAAALERACAAFDQRGAALAGLMASPLSGAEGNVEFFAHLVTSGGPARPLRLDRGSTVAAAVDEAVARPPAGAARPGR